MILDIPMQRQGVVTFLLGLAILICRNAPTCCSSVEGVLRSNCSASLKKFKASYAYVRSFPSAGM